MQVRTVDGENGRSSVTNNAAARWSQEQQNDVCNRQGVDGLGLRILLGEGGPDCVDVLILMRAARAVGRVAKRGALGNMETTRRFLAVEAKMHMGIAYARGEQCEGDHPYERSNCSQSAKHVPSMHHVTRVHIIVETKP